MPLALLKQLWEEHKDSGDRLNAIAAALPGALSAKQVQRLLRKHGLEDGAGAKKKGAAAGWLATRPQSGAA